MRVIIDVGATKIIFVVVDTNGTELSRERFPTDENYDAFAEQLTSKVAAVAQVVDSPLEAIAIGMPGMIDYQTNRVLVMGNRDWTDVDIAEKLASSFRVPVVLDNDANLGALGEARRGAGKNYRVVLYLTISTGIGSGVVVDGKIDSALAKSEAGKMLFEGDSGPVWWEKLASGKAFVDRYGRMGKDVPAEETQIWKEYAEFVSFGIIELIAVLEPDVIVIGGSMGEHTAKYLPHVLEFINQSKISPVPPIVQANNYSDAVIVGGIEAINDRLSR